MKKEPRLKVLHLVAIRGKGGTGASTAALIEGLAGKGHRVGLVCFSRSDLYQRLKETPNVEVVTGIYMSPLRRLGRLLRDVVSLLRIVKSHKVQIIHTHSSPDTWLGFFLSLLFPSLPFVRTRHVPVPLSGNPFNEVIHHRLKAVIAVSHAVKDAYLHKKAWRDKIRVIYDGVDLGRFSSCHRGNGFRKEIDLEEGILILNISRYAPVKGLQIFLEGVAPILRSWGNAKAVVVGRKREDLLPVLERHAKVLGIEDQVLFLEHRSDVPALMDSADLMVLTSVGSEGSSRVSLEAHAAGRPMVGTKVGAIGEVVDHLHTGMVIPPYNPSALTAALSPFAANRRLSKRMGAIARRRALWRMDQGFAVEKVEGLYRELLGE